MDWKGAGGLVQRDSRHPFWSEVKKNAFWVLVGWVDTRAHFDFYTPGQVLAKELETVFGFYGDTKLTCGTFRVHFDTSDDSMRYNILSSVTRNKMCLVYLLNQQACSFPTYFTPCIVVSWENSTALSLNVFRRFTSISHPSLWQFQPQLKASSEKKFEGLSSPIILRFAHCWRKGVSCDLFSAKWMRTIHHFHPEWCFVWLTARRSI